MLFRNCECTSSWLVYTSKSLNTNFYIARYGQWPYLDAQGTNNSTALGPIIWTTDISEGHREKRLRYVSRRAQKKHSDRYAYDMYLPIVLRSWRHEWLYTAINNCLAQTLHLKHQGLCFGGGVPASGGFRPYRTGVFTPSLSICCKFISGKSSYANGSCFCIILEIKVLQMLS